MDKRSKKYGIDGVIKKKKEQLNLIDFNKNDIDNVMEENLENYISLIKSNSIEEARLFAQNVGVNVHYDNLKVANYINSSLDLLKKRNLELPNSIISNDKIFKDYFKEKDVFYPAFFHHEDNTIYINPKAKLFKNLLFETRSNKVLNLWSTDESYHFFIHEYSHYKWYNKNKDYYDKMIKHRFSEKDTFNIRKHISNYASKNAIEFIAEIEVLFFYNKDIVDYLKEIYYTLIKGF